VINLDINIIGNTYIVKKTVLAIIFIGIFPRNSLEKKYMKHKKHKAIIITLSKFVEKV
jgi:hypothetical protein